MNEKPSAVVQTCVPLVKAADDITNPAGRHAPPDPPVILRSSTITLNALRSHSLRSGMRPASTKSAHTGRVMKRSWCSCGHAFTVRLIADVGEGLGEYASETAIGAGASCQCPRFTAQASHCSEPEIDEELPWRAA
jgi:hypothetical protein